MSAIKTMSSHVQSVEKALILMDLIAQQNREMSLTEIAKMTGWPKSTVHGILATLRDYRFIDQSPASGHYGLGIRLFELGHLVARSWDIRTVAIPVMQQLNSRIGEMIQLAMEDKGKVLYLEKVDSTHMIRIVSETGSRLDMHCTGLGKVLLAYKSPAEVRRIIARHGLPAMTSRTITKMDQLEQELEQIRQQGYAMDDREIMDSLRCVAAPIFDQDSQVKYALSVAGLASSMQGAQLEQAIDGVRKAAQDISFAMGYRGADQPK